MYHCLLDTPAQTMLVGDRKETEKTELDAKETSLAPSFIPESQCFVYDK